MHDSECTLLHVLLNGMTVVQTMEMELLFFFIFHVYLPDMESGVK